MNGASVSSFPGWVRVSRSSVAGVSIVVERCGLGGDEQLYRAMVEAGSSEVALTQPEARQRLADKLETVVRSLRG